MSQQKVYFFLLTHSLIARRRGHAKESSFRSSTDGPNDGHGKEKHGFYGTPNSHYGMDQLLLHRICFECVYDTSLTTISQACILTK